MMTELTRNPGHRGDTAPGDESGRESVATGVTGYAIGLALATGLTIASFYVASGDLIWQPGVPVALLALAVAQMGVHLAFFLHVTTGPDNTNNVLALAFGTIIVLLVVAGSMLIMAHLNANMMPMGGMNMNGGQGGMRSAPMSMPTPQ